MTPQGVLWTVQSFECLMGIPLKSWKLCKNTVKTTLTDWSQYAIESLKGQLVDLDMKLEVSFELLKSNSLIIHLLRSPSTRAFLASASS